MHIQGTRIYRLVLAGICLGATLMAAPAGATSSKPYSVSISPSTVAGGTTVTLTATLTNSAQAGQQLGSADLEWPASILTVTGASVTTAAGTATLSADCSTAKSLCLDLGSNCTVATSSGGTASGPCVEARNLAIPTSGKNTGTITMTATTQNSCNGSGLWYTEAKQANNFSGTGNSLDISPPPQTTAVQGACSLRFESANQPADADINTPISNTPYTPEPAGGPIKVDVLDTNGNVLSSYNGPVSVSLNTPQDVLTNPTPSTLGGTTTQNASGGVATFNDLTVNDPGNGYTLTASGPNASTAGSSAFNIHTTGTACGSGADCATETKSTDYASSTPGAIDVSINSPGTFLGITNPAAILSETIDFGTWPAATRSVECPDETPDAHFVYGSFTDSTGNSVTRSFTASITTWASPTADVTALIPGQEACFASAHPFTAQVGFATAPATAVTLPDGTPGYAGELPTCNNATGVNNPAFPTVAPTSGPCVSNRSGNPLAGGLGGTLTVGVSSPFDMWIN
jgi:hypothetical protein